MSADDEIRSLYRESPDAFIPARDALAKRLKEGGDPDEAARVKALRKPTVPAWAVDQLATTDPEGVDALLAAGAALRSAQQAALSGRHADRLREATDARRDAVARLTSAATRALQDAGRSPEPHIEVISATLEAASIDPEAGDRLRSGTLDRPLSAAAGFGDIVGLRSVGSGGGSSSPSSGRAAGRASAPSDEGSDGESAPAAAAEDRAREVEADVSRLRRDRDAAERRARRLGEDEDRAKARVGPAEQRLASVRDKAEEAHAAAELEHTEVRRLSKELERAEERLARLREGG
jgi:DNA repair exonuclease SbcCD ATPase subunit